MDYTETEMQIIVALRELKVIRERKTNGNREKELRETIRALSGELTNDQWELIEREVYNA